LTNEESEPAIVPTVAAARRFGTAHRHRFAQGCNRRSSARQGPTAGLVVALCAVAASGILTVPGAAIPATAVPSTSDHEEARPAAVAGVFSETVPTLAPAPVSVASVVDIRQEPDAPTFGWAGPAVVAGIAAHGGAMAPPVGQPSSGAALAAPDAQATTGLPAVAQQTPGLLPANRILTYYGHPHDPNMGILGEYPKDDLLGLLRAEAANYEATDPSRPVIPAFEVIATVAQAEPTQGGQYLLDTDTETLVEYADFAEANGILLFLDLQIGRNTWRPRSRRSGRCWSGRTSTWRSTPSSPSRPVRCPARTSAN
jgi:hypothetical protein